ncbi:hypothetical protein, partial [Pseudomonas sp. RIT409]|uniref:hypothetical protein n=1 Tax=Pseudomonas sp. RIT409 TaxID=2202159 RepID=UPI001C49B1D6
GSRPLNPLRNASTRPAPKSRSVVSGLSRTKSKAKAKAKAKAKGKAKQSKAKQSKARSTLTLNRTTLRFSLIALRF